MSEQKVYRKKPVEVKAVQYAAYGKLVPGMCNSTSCYTSGNNKPHVHTMHDGQIVNLEVGDFIIPEPDGKRFYPVKPDVFAATYEEVMTPPTDPRAEVVRLLEVAASYLHPKLGASDKAAALHYLTQALALLTAPPPRETREADGENTKLDVFIAKMEQHSEWECGPVTMRALARELRSIVGSRESFPSGVRHTSPGDESSDPTNRLPPTEPTR